MPARIIRGTVTGGYGVAAENLDPVMALIEGRMGLTGLVRGTLNLNILDDYIVQADDVIRPSEYPRNQRESANETIKLQRCLLAGYKGILMRPDSHELGQFHGTKHLEVMGQRNFREALGLRDGSEVEVQVEGDSAWWLSGK
jgi:CTP-dependent riboflavin kinase